MTTTARLIAVVVLHTACGGSEPAGGRPDAGEELPLLPLETCLIGAWLSAEDDCSFFCRMDDPEDRSVNTTECFASDCQQAKVTALRSDGHILEDLLFRWSIELGQLSAIGSRLFADSSVAYGRGSWRIEGGDTLVRIRSGELELRDRAECSADCLRLEGHGCHHRAPAGIETSLFLAWEAGDFSDVPLSPD